MEIVKLLGTFKGKALDLKDVELLKHAYQLQDENIKQLKTSNDLFREQVESLRLQIRERDSEIASLTGEIAQTKAQLEEAVRQRPEENSALSEEQTTMLTHLANHEDRRVYHTDIANWMSLPLTIVKHHMESLSNDDYVHLGYNMHHNRIRVSLTGRGRAYVVENNLVK